MELKRHVDLRKVVTVIYVAMFVVYLVVGLSPAEAAVYEVSDRLEIPSIGLKSDVTRLELTDHRLNTPDTIVGSYSRSFNKTLLIGHASTVFGDLNLMTVGESVLYSGKTWIVKEIALYKKEDVDMEKILASARRETLILMTCAGEVHGVDASHRLILVAER